MERVIVKVESAWAGKKIYQLLTLPDGSRERIESETWNRTAAREALDLLQFVYGFDRRAVRFDVK